MVLLTEDNGEPDSNESLNEKKKKDGKKKRHKNLLKDIKSISGVKRKRFKKNTITEPSNEISEHNWSTGASTKLQLHELVGSLDSNDQPIAITKKKLRKMENTTKILDKPLSKPESQKIQREVAYTQTKEEVSKWDPTVQKNREAEQLVFPLNQFKPPSITINSLVTFKPTNDLEREISAVLQGSKHLLERKDKELTEAEENALKEFDLEEALERRKELQKTRALQSYYETKCRRTKKIKSKKYHRILKKEKQKTLSKVDVVTLSKENPELFKSELDKAEKMRALERASLRHRNSSKWAKNLITKGKTNQEDQERIREQLRLSRQLTDHKVIKSDDDLTEDESAGEAENEKLMLLRQEKETDNPWMLSSNKNENKKAESTKRLQKLKPIVTEESIQNQPNEEHSQSNEEITDLAVEKQTATKDKASTKNFQLGGCNTNIKKENLKHIKIKNGENEKHKDKPKLFKSSQSSLEPDSLKLLRSDKDAIDLNIEDSSDDDVSYNEEQRMNIREAFANDDVIGEFINEKKEVIENSKQKTVDLTLPGWGEWAGPGLSVSKKKKERFTKQPRPGPKRKDEHIANVIISEAKNTMLALKQVGEVPFPYTSKEEYERSLRQPIGNLWNTPSVYNKIIEPRIRSTPGAIIEPIKPSRKIKKKRN
ncbi:U3 small nucleolar RNA-associated protein 14 homolog A isoform X2 [Hydra vulgaris]|uniref:U3 small nucleolar RNA-associated protein 14 homolog A isoform X2 n=1 Tax=Hydra vulgaris TaxID=6087 RepID=A0ABM4BKP6_HYDVU